MWHDSARCYYKIPVCGSISTFIPHLWDRERESSISMHSMDLLKCYHPIKSVHLLASWCRPIFLQFTFWHLNIYIHWKDFDICNSYMFKHCTNAARLAARESGHCRQVGFLNRFYNAHFSLKGENKCIFKQVTFIKRWPLRQGWLDVKF